MSIVSGPPPRLPGICDADATAALLDFGLLLHAVEQAAVECAAGAIACPDRLILPLVDGATLLSMPAVAADLVVHKLITVAPGNRARGLPTIQGTLTVVDPTTGTTRLVLDGPTVTARRTAAISLAAIRRLAAPEARRLLVIGTGAQAAAHVAAFTALLPQWSVRVRGRSRAASKAFCGAWPDLDLAPDDGAPADVVVTCTTSGAPVWTEPARDGTLLVAVGSFRPGEAEIGAATVRASTILVDDPASARREAGDLILADIDWDAVIPLATLVRDGSSAARGPMLFKSVGCAAWDLAAARVALAASSTRSSKAVC